MFSTKSRSMRGTSKKIEDPTIEIDKIQVTDDINENGKYDEDGILFQKWDNEEMPDYFLGQITKNNETFLGTFNGDFERTGYGFCTYENGDQYFGYFEE